MEFHASFSIGSVFHDAQQAFVRTFGNGHGLTKSTISAESLGWWSHGTISIGCSIPLHGRIHLHQVRACGSLGYSAPLCSDGGNIRGADDKDSGVFRLLSIMEEEKGMMDMDDDPLLSFATNFSNGVVVSNLRTIAVGSNSKLSLLDFVGNL